MNLSTNNLLSDKCAFEPFGSIAGILAGEPFKIMPIGKFYRDNRVLNITAQDLKAVEFNVKSGLPRFRIPINPDHKQDVGKIGTVHDVAYEADGKDGPGLYATKYELTDKGKALVKDDGYDAPSAELIWTKNGGQKYQDPNTGKYFDNVLVGVAFTPRPFFGHSEVSLYSATPPVFTENTMADTKSIPEKFMDMAGIQAMMDMLQKILALVTKDAELDKSETPEADANAPQDPNAPQGMAVPEQPAPETPKYLGPPVPVKKPPVPMPPGIAMQNMPAKPGSYSQETPTMDTEKFSITADEFAAVKAKADKADAMTAELAAIKTQADTFAAELAKERKSRRLDQLKDRAEKFMALPVKTDELAEKFAALEEASPDLFHYFEGLLEVADKQAVQSGLFSQVASGRRETSVETFDGLTAKVLTDKFAGDPAKYEQAMKEAAALRPDLVTAYIGARE